MSPSVSEVTDAAPSGALAIHHDVRGEPDDPALVLIAGLGAQLVFYPDELVQGFCDRMFRVIRLDNRDCGRSSSWPGPAVDVAALGEALVRGEPVRPPYTLSDMAGDVVAVLDAVGVERAHVLGTSLGGMIAQVLAVEHPDRVQSLTLVSSTTGEPDVGQPTPEALAALLRPSPATTDREVLVAHDVEIRRTWATPAYFDDDEIRAYFALTHERGVNPDGTSRQMAALVCEPPRPDALAALRVPTLVVHGDADPLIAPSGGERLVELIPDAELLVLEGMAHDLPSHYWAPLIEAVTRLAIRAR